jgi:hypothetical protein
MRWEARWCGGCFKQSVGTSVNVCRTPKSCVFCGDSNLDDIAVVRRRRPSDLCSCDQGNPTGVLKTGFPVTSSVYPNTQQLIRRSSCRITQKPKHLFNLFFRRQPLGKCDKSEKAQGASGQMRRVQFVMAIKKVVSDAPMLKRTECSSPTQ